jgi:hypothetical protein
MNNDEKSCSRFETAGLVEPAVFALALAIDAIDEMINPIDEKLNPSSGA